jgi:hypothetical protein
MPAPACGAEHLPVTRQQRGPDTCMPLEHMYEASVKCDRLEHAFAPR